MRNVHIRGFFCPYLVDVDRRLTRLEAAVARLINNASTSSFGAQTAPSVGGCDQLLMPWHMWP